MLGLLGAGCGATSGDRAATDAFTEVVPREVCRFELPAEEVVYRVAFSPDGRKVVAATMGGRVWVWDTDKPETPRSFEATSGELLTGSVLSLAFSPDGKRLLLGCADHTVQLWDFETGKKLRTLKAHEGPVWCVAFYKDGNRALSGSTTDYTIREWDLESGKELRRFKGKDRPDSLSLSPDERILVSTEFKNVRLWDLESGVAGNAFEGNYARVCGAFFTPDGKHIVSVSGLGEGRVWDVKTGKCLRQFGPEMMQVLVEGVALSSDGGRVLLGCSNELQIWDVQRGKRLSRIEKLDGPVHGAFSPDGRYFLSGEVGGVRLWDLSNRAGGKFRE
jgi:WD40 repeat protein